MAFGIPCNDDVSTAPVDAVCAANHDMLVSMIADLVTPLYQLTAQNDATIKRIKTHFSRQINSTLRENETRLAFIAGKLVQPINDLISRNWGLITHVESEVGDVEIPQIPVALVSVDTGAESEEGPESRDTARGESGGGLGALPTAFQAVAPPTPPPPTGILDFLIPRDPLAQTRPATAAPGPGGSVAPPPAPPPSSKPPGWTERTLPTPQEVVASLPQLPLVLREGIPVIGSASWCFVADELGTWLQDLAKMLFRWLEKVTDPDKIADWLDSAAAANASTLWGAWSSILSALAWVIRQLGPAWRGLRSAGIALWHYYDTIFGRQAKKSEALWSIWLLNSLLDSLNKFRAGSDSFIWATVDFSIPLTTVREMLKKMELYYGPLEIPAAHEATEAWLQGRIEAAQRDCIWRLHGLDPVTFLPFAMTRAERLLAREFIQYQRRLGVDDGLIATQLAQKYTGDPAAALQFLTMYDELPTISDHLEWLRKQVYDREYVEKYDLEDGFESKFWPAFGGDLRALGMQEKYARLHYAAHWIQPSPEQMREFLYRLRPDAAAGQKGFTLADFDTLLKEQDYAPRAREWFVKTAYRVPALTYVKDMYRSGVIDEAELEKIHLDLGYNPDDAKRFVGIDRLFKRRIRATQSHGWTPGAIAKAVTIGQMEETVARQRMHDAGYSDAETSDMLARGRAEYQSAILVRARSRLVGDTIKQVRDGLQVGTLSEGDATTALTGMGWTPAQAGGIVSLQSAQAHTARIRTGVARVRSAYLAGEIDEDGAATHLDELGIKPGAKADYLLVWKLSLTPGKKRRTASQIVQNVADGLMSEAEALAGLDRLGYTNADSLLYLADARAKVIGMEADIVRAGTDAGSRREQQLTALAQHAGGLSTRIVGQLERQAPVGRLRKWLKVGVMTPDEFRKRMRLYGYSEEVITNEIATETGAQAHEQVAPPAPGKNGKGH